MSTLTLFESAWLVCFFSECFDRFTFASSLTPLELQVTNTISFAFSLLGTSMVIRRLGLKMTLLAFPCMCLAVVIMVMMFPELYVSVNARRW